MAGYTKDSKDSVQAVRLSFRLPHVEPELDIPPNIDCSDEVKDIHVPNAVYWSVEDVANWISLLGFPYYKEPFIFNNIDGKQLIKIDASSLPRMGITKWEDIQVITKNIRDLLYLENPNHFRTIRLPPRNNPGMHLEAKSFTGNRLSCLTLPRFTYVTKDQIWEPPLENRGLIFDYSSSTQC